MAHYHNAINRDESGPLDQAGHNLSANAGKICFLARFIIFLISICINMTNDPGEILDAHHCSFL